MICWTQGGRMTKRTDKGAPVANGRAPVAAQHCRAVEPAFGVPFCGDDYGQGGGSLHPGSDSQLKPRGVNLLDPSGRPVRRRVIADRVNPFGARAVLFVCWATMVSMTSFAQVPPDLHIDGNVTETAAVGQTSTWRNVVAGFNSGTVNGVRGGHTSCRLARPSC